jgi:gamma-glutamylcyclotransferase (GGCT)/AIG2-like uncharacterized protein YtfP
MNELFDFFFYGTLRDGDVREVVMGPGAGSEIPAGLLPGYRCAPVEGGRFPAVQADAGHAAPGVLAAGVSLTVAARLSYFEGEGYDYGVERCAIELDDGAAEAWVFLPSERLQTEGGTWDIANWRALHKSQFVEKATATMEGCDGDHLARHMARWRHRLETLAAT